MSIQGVGKEKIVIALQCEVKVTLDWQLTYTFTVWIGDHHGGANLILGTDFMMPAGGPTRPISRARKTAG